jgi:hypothetical protein
MINIKHKTGKDQEGLDVGEDSGTPVNLNYDVPFKFTGKLDRVTIVLK